MTTGERIRARREAIGMTALELGEHIGVAKSTIGRYERGTIRKIPYDHLFKMAIAMGTTVADLTGANENGPVDEGESRELIDFIAGLERGVAERLSQLSPEELAKVDAFAQGIIASRKE